MRLPLLLSMLMATVLSSDVTVILVGSRYKLTEQRVREQRERIMEDCHVEKIKCHVYDALNEWPESEGMWTLFPAILKLPTSPNWTILASDTSRISISRLKMFTANKSANEDVYSGFGLVDKEPTIIHHFGMNVPENFRYPLLYAGILLSRSVVQKIQSTISTERVNFAIDASYEFSLSLHKWHNLHLTHEPNYFCPFREDFESETCIVHAKIPTQGQSVLPDELVHVMIKTFSGHHTTRLPVLQHTWTRDIQRIEYCSDKADSKIPTIDLGVQNTEHGHCGKTWAILRRFLQVSGDGAKWLLVADDDTLMSWTRLKKMLAAYDPDDAIIIGERYGFGFGMQGDSGYDYPTGGSGMIFSRSAVENLLDTCPSCASDSDPDDMTIGMCAIRSGISIIHEPRLHQARPQDYAAEYLHHPISFHKYTEIDPMMVFYYYLVDEDDYRKTEL
uniref:N-acetylgalactosaminide beta-1,3-galactosyltransferase n=1 Tax=Caenorhabditis japonica TaxID=281687 RepID=A0A8R1DUN7_CAEJA